MTKKPLILWLADTPGWAYDSIVRQNTQRLTQYDHAVYYMVSRDLMRGSTFQIPTSELDLFIEEADILVCMYLPYLEICPNKEKVAFMLTGMRPFE